RLRELGTQLFGVPQPIAHRSLRGQDQFAATLREHGQKGRTVLQGLYERLGHLGVESGPRREELAMANGRLAPLAQATRDSQKVLNELLAQWPDNSSDPVRTVVQQAEVLRGVLGEVDEQALKHLQDGIGNPLVGAQAKDHLASLHSHLTAGQAELPL